MEIKDSYTKEELVEILVSNNNKIMKMIDPKKRFVMNHKNKTVEVEIKNFIGQWKYSNEYTYDEIINQSIK